jgi:SAM-dependent methyltransferase
MSWYRQAFAAHYPVLYAHRDEEEAARCIALLPRLAPLGDGPVLDLGCGTGRHLPGLGGDGRTVVGLDLSRDLLAIAAERRRPAGGPFPLLCGDMRRLPLGTGSVSAVCSLFTAFGYFGGLADHDGMLAEIGRVLRNGGHWFLDYLNCEAVRRELEAAGPAVRSREIGPLVAGEKRRLAAAPARVVKEVRLRARAGREDEAARLGVTAAGLRYREEVALFALAELDALAAGHGLTRVAAAGGYDGRPLTADADRWLLAYRRRSGREEGRP